jgi:hypothetical protein
VHAVPDYIAPTFKDYAYGPHERHLLDFWQVESPTPTPLAIFIHGGAFLVGRKETINVRVLRELLDAGISVGAINYRLLSHAPLPAAHHDGRRALQIFRSKAEDWNLDKGRVGAFGTSAGAQICMWLGFHDEMADLDSPDPVEHESTRLTCVAADSAQTTMDVAWWQQWIPGYDTPHRDFYKTFDVQLKAAYLKEVAGVSALSLVSKGAPPLLLSYSMSPNDPIPAQTQKAFLWKVHHVIFGVKLKDKMDAMGLEAHLNYPGARPRYSSTPHFFKAKLKAHAASMGRRAPAYAV